MPVGSTALVQALHFFSAIPKEFPLAPFQVNASLDVQELLQEALRGDERAKALIVERYVKQVYRFCFRMLGNEEDAMDAAQETLLKLVRNLGNFDPSRRFSTWVFSIARNNCIDMFRKRSKQGSMPERDIKDEGPGPLDIAEKEQRATHLRAALESLSPRHREVLLLYHFEHLKYREIAEVLQQPMGTVMNRIFRARRDLRLAYDAIIREARS